MVLSALAAFRATKAPGLYPEKRSGTIHYDTIAQRAAFVNRRAADGGRDKKAETERERCLT